MVELNPDTYDETTPMEERTRLEIKRAAKASTKSKLIFLAGHLYNLRDIDGVIPASEPNRTKKVRDYFQWSSNLVQGVRGPCKKLEDELDMLYKQYDVINNN